MMRHPTVEEMYFQLTDGDMPFDEYLTCLPVNVEQLVNQTSAKSQQHIKCDMPDCCIKCCFTNRFKQQYCII